VQGRGPGSNLKVYIVIGLLALAAIAGLLYGPVMRGILKGRMENAQSTAEAIAAADEFMKFVTYSESYVHTCIHDDVGPIESQLHMAKTCKLYPALIDIAERGSASVQPGAKPALTAPQMVQALQLAAQFYSREKHGFKLPPSALEAWATKHEDPEVSKAAIGLIAAINDPDPERSVGPLARIAKVAGQDPVRIEPALNGLAQITTSANLGYALELLKSNASDQVVQNQRLSDAITGNATVNHLPVLIGLLSHPQTKVRALALSALGGRLMSLAEDDASFKRRVELGELLSGKLAAEVHVDELAAALKATRSLRLIGASGAIFKLLPKVVAAEGGVAIPGVDAAFWSDLLGKAFIFKSPAEGRKLSEEVIAGLNAALDKPDTRVIAANALGLITDPGFRALRTSLDKLVVLGSDDPTFLNVLITLITSAYQRGDIVKTNGNDVARWKKFLADDRPRFDRYREIEGWYADNAKFHLVSDGRPMLAKCKAFIEPALEQLNGWLEDAAFVPPLGLNKKEIEFFARQFREHGMVVRQSLAGALQ